MKNTHGKTRNCNRYSITFFLITIPSSKQDSIRNKSIQEKVETTLNVEKIIEYHFR